MSLEGYFISNIQKQLCAVFILVVIQEQGNNVYYAWDSNLAIKNTKTKEPHKKVKKKKKTKKNQQQQQKKTQFNVKKPKLSLLK